MGFGELVGCQWFKTKKCCFDPTSVFGLNKKKNFKKLTHKKPATMKRLIFVGVSTREKRRVIYSENCNLDLLEKR